MNGHFCLCSLLFSACNIYIFYRQFLLLIGWFYAAPAISHHLTGSFNRRSLIWLEFCSKMKNVGILWETVSNSNYCLIKYYKLFWKPPGCLFCVWKGIGGVGVTLIKSIVAFVISQDWFHSQQYPPVGLLIHPLAQSQLSLSPRFLTCESRSPPDRSHHWRRRPSGTIQDFFCHGGVCRDRWFDFVLFPLHLCLLNVDSVRWFAPRSSQTREHKY